MMLCRTLRTSLFIALLAGLIGLSACSPDITLPPAKALEASAAQLAEIPALAPGPYPVVKSEPSTLTLGDRQLRLRVVEPQGTGPFALILFSHGFASDIDQYDALLTHWASHGYIVVAPYHLDGGGTVRAIFNSVRKGNEGLIAARVDDMRSILDHLPALDALSPGLTQRIDTERIAAAGHSFGAFTAQQLGGAVAVNPESGEMVIGRDPRVRAVVAVSPPGRMFGLITEQSWLAVEVPMLVTTGTWDVDGRFVHEWREHALSFDTAPSGHNWLLVVEGADHYLGNLICRLDRKAAPQGDALKMVNAVSVSFLNAFVYADPAARQFLYTPALQTLTGGFAALSQR